MRSCEYLSRLRLRLRIPDDNTLHMHECLLSTSLAAALSPDSRSDTRLSRPQNTVVQWRIIFFVTSGLFVFHGVQYILFASGEEQQWAKDARRRAGLALPTNAATAH